MNTKQKLFPLLLALASGVIASLPFINHSLGPLIWCAFAPLIFVLEKCTDKQAYFYGLLTGFSFFAGSNFWVPHSVGIFLSLSPVHSVAFSVLYWLYCGNLIAVACFLAKWVVCRSGISMVFVLPTFFVLIHAYAPQILKLVLAITLMDFPMLLQIVDIVGSPGLDWLIVLVNCCVAKIALRLTSKGTEPATTLEDVKISMTVISLYVGYSILSYGSWDAKSHGAQKIAVGIIQPNFREEEIKAAKSMNLSLSIPREFQLAEQLDIAPELTILPELTTRGYFDNDAIQSAFLDFSASFHSPLIIQDVEPSNPKPPASEWNTSVLLSGGQEIGKYRKQIPMPVGETDVRDTPMIGKLLRRILPPKDQNSLSLGSNNSRYELDNFTVAPIICYESIFPTFVSRTVFQSEKADLLTVQSNNLWFGESALPYQHAATVVLRAIENRVASISAVNNGPSIAVGPSGRIIWQSDFYNRESKTVLVPIDRDQTKTIFSANPSLFLKIMAIWSLLMSLRCLIVTYRSSKV